MVETTEGAHGKTAVLQLGQLILLELLRVLAQPQWVEAKVAWGTFSLERPDEGQSAEYLEEGHEEEDLGHATGLNEEVMCCDRVQRLTPREQEKLGHDISENSEHCNAAYCARKRKRKLVGVRWNVQQVTNKKGVVSNAQCFSSASCMNFKSKISER